MKLQDMAMTDAADQASRATASGMNPADAERIYLRPQKLMFSIIGNSTTLKSDAKKRSEFIGGFNSRLDKYQSLTPSMTPDSALVESGLKAYASQWEQRVPLLDASREAQKARDQEVAMSDLYTGKRKGADILKQFPELAPKVGPFIAKDIAKQKADAIKLSASATAQEKGVAKAVSDQAHAWALDPSPENKTRLDQLNSQLDIITAAKPDLLAKAQEDLAPSGGMTRAQAEALVPAVPAGNAYQGSFGLAGGSTQPGEIVQGRQAGLNQQYLQRALIEAQSRGLQPSVAPDPAAAQAAEDKGIFYIGDPSRGDAGQMAGNVSSEEFDRRTEKKPKEADTEKADESSYSSAADVHAAFKSGKIDRDEAARILVEQFGMTE